MPSRRLQLLIFALSFITFAWFHQGGGWNQNARFAEVRAVVEQGRLAVNDYIVFRPAGGRRMAREQVENGEFVRDGKTYRLCWRDSQRDHLIPANGRPVGDGTEPVVIGRDTCTGDIGYSPDGHFHPNKPPGASLLAVPVYFVVYHAERALGMHADDWWVMNVNSWLCSMLTVGLASALGVVLMLRLASQLFPGHLGAAVGAAITFGFGTTFLPFGTMMFDHNLTAVFLLASFAAVRGGSPAAAGAWAGIAVVTNYLAAVPCAVFGVWALLRRRDGRPGWHAALRYAAGVLPGLGTLLLYNTAAFGSPFALNTSFQNPAFQETAPAFLGMFTWPSWFATIVVTVSPWRGLFTLSPVLLLSLVVMAWPGGMKGLASERRVILACAAYFLFINICFNGFHGGFSAGPRYLIPALPFICLPLAAAFAWWPRVSSILAAAGIAQQALLTITDALNPLGVGDHAWVNYPGEWKEKLTGNSIVWRYAWPFFSEGRPAELIAAKFDEWVRQQQQGPDTMVPGINGRQEEFARMCSEAWARVERGEDDPLLIAAIEGPVSVNVLAPWDGTYFRQFPAHSEPAKWAAFNAGEFLWSQSRWSVLPLLLSWIGGSVAIRRLLRNVENA